MRGESKGSDGAGGDVLPGGQRDEGSEQKREGQAEEEAHLRGRGGADGAGQVGLCRLVRGLRGGGCEGGSDPQEGHSLAVGWFGKVGASGGDIWEQKNRQGLEADGISGRFVGSGVGGGIYGEG